LNSEPTTPAFALKREGDSGAALVAALEHAWEEIGKQHPDLPAAVIILGQGSGPRGGLLLGHLAPDRWQTADGRGTLAHELLIGGEGLARGAHDVFTTVLHEAAHVLAIARDIADTSTNGRYHNARYKQLAEQLGLHVARDRHFGWSTTTLPSATRERYQPAIDAIANAITRHRLTDPSPRARRNLRPALCACPRRIRVAQGTLAAGAIICGVCQQPFRVGESTPP
jgi:hypothetical protein